jgi:acyl-CoA reductase-like NAD-dependent aldehyde dehydrogenase
MTGGVATAPGSTPGDVLAMTIGGRSQYAGSTIPVIDPADGRPFAACPDCSLDQLEQAVSAAHTAFQSWRTTGEPERRDTLLRLVEVTEAHSDELAALVTAEQGKPLAKARSEINAGLAYARAYAAMDLSPEIVRDSAQGYAEVRRVPVGVVAAITAWNYPLLLALWKLAPAIRAGNTVVVKPSPLTPLATLRLGELLASELPPGLVNVISGGDELGRRLVEHDLVSKVSFTGSVATGRAIMRSAGSRLKRLTLELGGNDAGIVLPGSDPAEIAEDLFWAAFSNCGQVCAGLKRLYVPEALMSTVCDALAEVAAGVTVGPGDDPGTDIGPVQNAPQLARVRSLVADARSRGGDPFFVGEAPGGDGYFHPAVLIRDVAEGVRIVDEEQFGPVLPILPYATVDEAVARANATDYALGGSVWGPDFEQAIAVASRLDAGSVWVGQHPGMGPDLPFGGLKQSGLGVEGSRLGLLAYTDVQVLNARRG